MAENLVLDAAAREGTGKGAARAARREGMVPGVIYGGGQDPVTISVKFNELLKLLKRGKFLSTLMTVKVGNDEHKVICRAVQRDVVKDLPTHVDFLRLSDRSRINLYIPVEFENEAAAPGLKKGGVLTVVRSEVELKVTANAIPEKLVVDLTGREIGDTIHISDITLPQGTRPMITDRDFVIANIQAPSGLASQKDDEDGEGEEAETEAAAEE
ncbi:50S ribosomal protein L25/general stress protein Ctc [Pontivivens ytuae]|uniref:Large ribosomal subunit protein bL25 n=1 Tax=Pontivivens ytuae TaxID=2789856 RepID=A0A7S9LVA5_9RHOB|nr:50S ribosomal protein L25/general stress protein Ctc [Pontivivens ytuae]QPH55826.1 50S ribosomal protein L25/general stress protein Ctc [Pontivivens ytuae]